MNAPERIWAWCFNAGEFGGWGSWGGTNVALDSDTARVLARQVIGGRQ